MNNQADKSVRAECVVTLQPNTLQHIDCMDFMRECPSNYFDLAIVDPPYGLNEKFKGGETGKMNFNEVVNKEWDKKPDEAYFNELKRVSKNQIIWGGNYFTLGASRGFIIWDKLNSEDFSLAMCEFAWTSFDKRAVIYRKSSDKKDRIHPTQKPTELYTWLLKKYAKSGDKILDTHVGSGSSLVACKELGFEYYGCEIDAEYFAKANERIARAYRKYELFE